MEGKLSTGNGLPRERWRDCGVWEGRVSKNDFFKEFFYPGKDFALNSENAELL